MKRFHLKLILTESHFMLFTNKWNGIWTTKCEMLKRQTVAKCFEKKTQEFFHWSCNVKLELDSTMSQSRIEFWNWIFNFQIESKCLTNLNQFALSLLWKFELNWMFGCWEKCCGGGWYNSGIESFQVLFSFWLQTWTWIVTIFLNHNFCCYHLESTRSQTNI